MLCAAPTVLIGIANAPEELRRLAPRGVRVLTAGAPPAAATIERVEGELGWEITQVYGLTEVSPFISICEPRPEHARLERARPRRDQGAPGRRTAHLRRSPRGGRARAAKSRATARRVGEIVVRGNVVMAGYYHDPEGTAQAIRDGWFHSGDAAVVHPDGYLEIRDRLKDVIISGGENISSVEVEGVLLAASRRAGSGRGRHCRTRNGARRRMPSSSSRRARPRPKPSCGSSRGSTSRISKSRRASPSSPNCRRQRPARFRSTFCVAARISRDNDRGQTWSRRPQFACAPAAQKSNS